MQRMVSRRRSNGGSKIRRKRRAALMLSAAAMGVGTAATSYVPDSATAMSQTETAEQRRHAGLLTTSDEIRRALIEEEGVRYTTYVDDAGFVTVGVGHRVTAQDDLSAGDRIGKRRVFELLKADLDEAEQSVRRLVGDLPLTQHEFDALVDLAFNVGEGNLMPANSPRLNAAILAADYDGIAAELDYSHAGGARLEGLSMRSERRSQIFLEGEYEEVREA